MKCSGVNWVAILWVGLGLMFGKVAVANEGGNCESPEYKLLEDHFLDLKSSKRERFFQLDKLCMLELGLDKDDIVERRTIFLMGFMNYEHYGELE